MDKQHQTGKRFQVIIVQIQRNKDDSIRELLKLQDHLKRENEHYKFLGSFYGSPSNSLNKTVEWYIDNEHLAHPVKSLYDINKIFMDRKKVKTEDVANMGLYAEYERLVKGFKILLGGHPEEKRDEGD